MWIHRWVIDWVEARLAARRERQSAERRRAYLAIRDHIQAHMDSISGVNSVARGNPSDEHIAAHLDAARKLAALPAPEPIPLCKPPWE